MISNPIKWPNGARCAVAITFDMDADSLVHIAQTANITGQAWNVDRGEVMA